MSGIQPEADLRAAFFDFDGLLVDTESPAYAEWRRTYARFDLDLTLESWSVVVGTLRTTPFIELQKVLGRSLDPSVEEETDLRAERACDDEALLPGAAELIASLDEAGVRRAVVSSSPEEWVRHHLDRLACDGWAAIECSGPDRRRSKPSPELYVSAMRRLEVEPAESIAFEDSTNGIAAAKAAGIFTVAVPNAITRDFDLGAADLVLDSLALWPRAGM